MSTPFDTQNLGVKLETAYGTNLITLSTTEYYNLGKYTLAWGEFPRDDRTLYPVFTGAQRYPDSVSLAKYHATGGFLCTAINAFPIYLALGDNASSGGGPYTNTLSYSAFGEELPFFTVRTEDFNDSNGIYEIIPGTYMKNLTTSIDLRQHTNRLAYSGTFWGQKQTVCPFATASTGRVDPVNTAAESLQFRYDTNTVFNWGGTFSSSKYASGGTAYTNDLIDFSWTLDNDIRPDLIQGQKYPENFIFGRQTSTINFNVLRKAGTTLYTDCRTMQDGTTTKNIHFKIYKDSTYYLQFDFENCKVESIKRNNTINTSEYPVYNVTMIPENVKVTEYSANLAGGTYYEA